MYQNKQLAEWLQSIGCPVQLSDKNLTKLNSLNMRSVWRHLQTHIKTVQCIQIIKKNLLLSRLRKETIFPGKFGHLKIESIHELSQLQKISVTQEQINCIKMKIEAMDKNLKLLIPLHFVKNTEKESIKLNLKESREKTVILKLQLSCIYKNTESITKQIDTAKSLKTCHPTFSYPELNHMKSTVCKYLSKHKLLDSQDDLISEIIVASQDFPVSVISGGIYLASQKALKSLNAFRTNLDVSADVQKIEQKLAAKGLQTFSEHLNTLNFLVLENEINIRNCFEKIIQQSCELEKEKMALVNAVEEMYLQHEITTESNSSHISGVQIVNSLVNNVRVVKKREKIKHFFGELNEKCSDFDNIKCLVDTVKERENELQKRLDKKVDDLNKLITLLCTCSMANAKTEAFQKCSESASFFLKDLKLNKERDEEIFLRLGKLVAKEIEMFQKAPLVAMLRKWDELIQKQSVQNRFKDNLLITLLCPSEPKNIIKSTVEKIVWSVLFYDKKIH